MEPAAALLALQANPSISMYEVLGRHDSCRVFLDLEYRRAINPDRTPAQDAEAVQLL